MYCLQRSISSLVGKPQVRLTPTRADSQVTVQQCHVHTDYKKDTYQYSSGKTTKGLEWQKQKRV